MRTTLYLLLFYLFSYSLSTRGQNITSYEGGEVFTVKTENNKHTMTPVGSGGKVVYHSLSNSYTVTWRKDGAELSMTFKYIGKIEALNLFQEEAGKQYALDTGNLNTEGVFFALLVNLKNRTVSNEGFLITSLKRK